MQCHDILCNVQQLHGTAKHNPEEKVKGYSKAQPSIRESQSGLQLHLPALIQAHPS